MAKMPKPTSPEVKQIRALRKRLTKFIAKTEREIQTLPNRPRSLSHEMAAKGRAKIRTPALKAASAVLGAGAVGYAAHRGVQAYKRRKAGRGARPRS